MTNKVIVADTGPLIALGMVQLLPIVPQLFSEIIVPTTVVIEATKDLAKPGGKAINKALIDGYIIQQNVVISALYEQFIKLLDKGEAETLSLAHELSAIALVDERKGRRVAEKHGIPLTGTAAILIKAKREGLIHEVKPLLDMFQQHGYRLSSTLIDLILQSCRED